MTRRLVASLALAVAVALAACGGSDQGDAVATSTVTETTTTAVEPVADTTKPPGSRPRPPTPADEAEAAVTDYYAAVDARRFGRAWDLLGPTLQAELGGYASWKGGYETTVGTKAKAVHASNVSSSAATVAIELEATDLDACGDLVDQSFAGTWSLDHLNGQYLGTAFSVDKVAGATPVTDASSCGGGGGGGAVAPLSSGGCDPNYTGCVPPYPPDVDCIEVGQEVGVIGEDVHNLDLGGDGEACEVFFK